MALERRAAAQAGGSKHWELVMGRRKAGVEPKFKWWTEAEDAQLRELRMLRPTEIARRIGRTVEAVKARMQRLGIEGYRTWMPHEDQVLREAVQGTTAPEIAKKLGRTTTAVHHRMHKLGLSVWSKQRWTEAEVEQLRALAPGHNSDWVAARMGRSVRAIEHKVQQLGLKIAGFRSYRWPERAKAESKPRPVRIKAKSQKPEVSRIVWCSVCSAPVVNTFDGWAKHNERMGCNRAKARVA